MPFLQEIPGHSLVTILDSGVWPASKMWIWILGLLAAIKPATCSAASIRADQLKMDNTDLWSYSEDDLSLRLESQIWPLLVWRMFAKTLEKLLKGPNRASPGNKCTKSSRSTLCYSLKQSMKLTCQGNLLFYTPEGIWVQTLLGATLETGLDVPNGGKCSLQSSVTNNAPFHNTQCLIEDNPTGKYILGTDLLQYISCRHLGARPPH